MNGPGGTPELVAEGPILAGLLRSELERSHREGREPLPPERRRPQ